MANLKEIRVRLNSVRSTRQITSAMKMVSAAKLRRAQDAITQLRPYYFKLSSIIQNVGSQLEEGYKGRYEKADETGRVLIVALTSNRGLCGAFNANIVKRTIQCILDNFSAEQKEGKVDVISIGKKGTDLLKSRKFPPAQVFNSLYDNLIFSNVSTVSEGIMNDFISGKYKKVMIVYNQFRNAAVQEVTAETFLPVDHVKEPEPVKKQESKYETYVDYILEPSISGIYDEMVPYYLKIQFFRTLLESLASEHGARMTAMHKATDNATDLIRDLQLNYNKARQASITGEILEIVGGANALNG